MNVTFRIHPGSALLGLALGVVALLSMSQMAIPVPVPHRVECGPHPHDMVQIQGGVPFTVPPGRSSC